MKSLNSRRLQALLPLFACLCLIASPLLVPAFAGGGGSSSATDPSSGEMSLLIPTPPTTQDCNDNGTPDGQDIANCLEGDPACDDCNSNGSPDECDLSRTVLLTIARHEPFLHILDPETGQTLDSVFISLPGEYVSGGTGLATHPITGELWAVLAVGYGGEPLGGPPPSELATINPRTGRATAVGTLGDRFAGLAFDDAGTLYGVTGGQNVLQPESLFSIDLTDASTTLLAALTPAGQGEAIAFIPAEGGFLFRAGGYLGVNAGNGQLLEYIDLDPLEISGPISTFGFDRPAGMTLDLDGEGFLLIANGQFVGGGQQSLISLGTDGNTAPIGPVDYQSKGLAFVELDLDCNGNSIPDACDIESGFSLDCNSNGVPDGCEEDCDGNGTPDDCEIGGLYSIDRYNPFLHLINPDTGDIVRSVLIAMRDWNVQGGKGLTVHPVTGELWALLDAYGTNVGQPPQHLVTLDRSTGEATIVHTLGYGYLRTLAFNADGSTLYTTTGGNAPDAETLYTIDLGTGVLGDVAELSESGGGEALAFNPDDGFLYRLSGVGGKGSDSAPDGFGGLFERIVFGKGVELIEIPLSGTPIEKPRGMTYDPSLGSFLVAGSAGFNPRGGSDRALLTLTADEQTTLLDFMNHKSKGLAIVDGTANDCNQNGVIDGCEDLIDTVLVSLPCWDPLLQVLNPNNGQTLGTIPISLAGYGLQGGTGLATHPLTGELWGVLVTGFDDFVGGPETFELVTIDPQSGAAERVGTLDDAVAGLAFDSEGTLYGVTGGTNEGGQAATPESLFEISQTDAAMSLLDVGLTPGLPGWYGYEGGGEAIAFNPIDGLLYRAGGTEFQTATGEGGSYPQVFESIDPDSLETSYIGASGFVRPSAMTFEPASGRFLLSAWMDDYNSLGGPPPSFLYALNTDGEASLITDLNHHSKGLAFVERDLDCNENGAFDSCDIAEGFSDDCNENGVPDECEEDCNGNSTPDACELGGIYSLNRWDGLLHIVGRENAVSSISIQIILPGWDEVNGGFGLAVHPDTGELWAILELYEEDNDRGGPEGYQVLATVNRRSGEASAVGMLHPDYNFRALAFNADGSVLFATTRGEADQGPGIDPESLFILDQTSASHQFLGNLTESGGGEALAFNPDDGFLYRLSAYDGFPPLDDPPSAFNGFEKIEFDEKGIVDIFTIPLTGVQIDRPRGMTYDPSIGSFIVSGSAYNNLGGPNDALLTLTTDGQATLIDFLDHRSKGLAIIEGTVSDCDANGIPDECDPDCNGNGTPDACDMAACEGELDCGDCNYNGVPDACDIADGASEDCNGNGIPDECDMLSVFELSQIPYEFDYVDLDWDDDCDDCATGIVELPFAVQIGGVTFTHFELDSNGYVELLRAGEAPYEESYGDVDDLINSGIPHHTFLMAAYDDLDSSEYGEYGYTLEAGRAVFFWETETHDDEDEDLLNVFEIILYADGSVQWNFDYAEYEYWDEDLFSGMYLGYDRQELIEIYRDFIPEEESWLVTEMITSDCNGNGILDVCEPDCDDDGVPDGCEDDGDDDGVPDDCDNCPADPNPDQEDADDDGLGDFCDPDSDGDGIDDVIEAAGPNGGDADGDGTPDSRQPNTASLPSTLGDFVTLTTPAGTILKQVEALENPSPDDAPAVGFPIGFFSFAVNNLSPGEATTVTLLLPPGVTVTTYYKYGPTPDNPAPHWYEFPFDGTTGAEILGDVIVLHFVDGLRGDDDLTANGIIVDDGAPAAQSIIPAPQPGPQSGPQPAPGGIDPELLRYFFQSFCGVPACGLGWMACMPITCMSLYGMKLSLRRNRRRRKGPRAH